MTRRKIFMSAAAEKLALADEAGRLAVRVTPNASADAILLPSDDSSSKLLVRTTATPEDGKANEAVLRLLADALKEPVSSPELLRGGSGRSSLSASARREDRLQC